MSHCSRVINRHQCSCSGGVQETDEALQVPGASRSRGGDGVYVTRYNVYVRSWGGIKLEDEQNTIGCMHHLAILARWAEEGRSAGSPNANNLVYNVQGGGGEEGAGPRSRMEADHRIRHLDLDFFFFFLPSLLIFSLCFRISRTKV